MTRFQKWLTVAFLVFVTAVAVTAQNPVSILQVGRATAVGTTLPISGTVTANAGTNLNTSALSTEATLSTLNGKVTAVNTGAVVIASGSVTANAGTNLNTSALATETTLAALNTKVTAVNTGAVVLSAGSALIGTAATGATATVTNAALTSYTAATASTNATLVKNGPGNVYHFRAMNLTSTLYYLRMYNLSSAPTCNSATGFVETIPIPQATGTGAGVVDDITVGAAYSTGIGFCITGGAGSTDNTNAAVGVYVTTYYK